MKVQTPTLNVALTESASASQQHANATYSIVLWSRLLLHPHNQESVLSKLVSLEELSF